MYVAPPFKSHSQPAKLMQPAQCTLNNPSSYAETASMRLTPSCQDWRNMSAPQLPAQWLRVISPVSLPFPRPSPWPASLTFQWGYRLHKEERLGNIVRIRSSQQNS